MKREAGAAKPNHFSRLKKGGQRPPSTMTRQGYDDKRSWSKFAKQKTLESLQKVAEGHLQQ